MASTTTTNLALIKPTAGTNEPASIFTSHNPNMDKIDLHDHGATLGAPIKRIQSGTFAARPAAGNAGHVYVATDTAAAYFDTGAAWVGMASLGANAFTGVQTNSAQPAFLAFNSVSDANQTGAGATATLDFDTEVYDQAANFAVDTFTAPVTGRYHLDSSSRVFSIPAGATSFDFKLVTSNRTYRKVWVMVAGTFSQYTFDITVDADMDAGDTATVQLIISGGAGNTASISGDAASIESYFAGHLVA
ncbi:MAG TPA: hypothetical protein VNM48_04905 [Chloroflexota bacterium]|nr:hypothetical protein [Chloroflexota bacterium]